jgi:F0F1-type ATP synthase assembly protein I
MSTSQNSQSRKSRAKRPVRRRSPERAFSWVMRGYAYTATTVILVGLLVGVGWLYYSNRIQNTDSILMFIIAQILGVWVGLTNKIFRIQNQNPDKPTSPP